MLLGGEKINGTAYLKVTGYHSLRSPSEGRLREDHPTGAIVWMDTFTR